MKSFLLALSLLAGINVQASTIDGYSLSLVGVQAEENFTMNAVQTRTEYRTETVARTCFRTVSDGYQRQCSSYPEQRCYEDNMSRRICRTEYVNRCRDEIRYRQEAYTCYENTSVPYEVFSNNVKANVIVRVSAPVQPTPNSCAVNFTLNGNKFNAVANCADYIVLAKQSAGEARVGDTVVQTRTLDLTLVDARTVTAPVKGGIRDLKLEGQTLVFKTGDLSKNPSFALKLFVERKKLFGDDTLINRNLAPSEYTYEKTSEDSGIVKINLSKLIGGINASKKHAVRVDLNVIADTAASINSSLPNFSTSESIIVNN
jgi:hypothetical protein